MARPPGLDSGIFAGAAAAAGNGAAHRARRPPGGPQFSRCGDLTGRRYLAWLGDSPGDAAKPLRRGIHVTDLHAAAKTPRRVTAGDGKTHPTEHGAAWSPDG